MKSIKVDRINKILRWDPIKGAISEIWIQSVRLFLGLDVQSESEISAEWLRKLKKDSKACEILNINLFFLPITVEIALSDNIENRFGSVI